MDGQQWTIFSAAQNLPAVLNDPNKGKQRDFFTRTWGDGFVEKTDIPKPGHLPDITLVHFEAYFKKIARRYRKHARMNASSPKSTSHNEFLQHFPNLKAVRSLDKNQQFDVSNIPKIFLQPNLDLSKEENFNAVYPFSKETMSPIAGRDIVKSTQNSGKLLQEKLSHYLDMVEVQIAQQVAQKSDAFFHAMTSHDALMEQLTQTITVVKALREKVHHIDNTLVKKSLDVLRLERRQCNYNAVYEKIKIMATVHQTQPTIQLLLSAPDYVAALDLISTTQEIIVEELTGIQSFRHLGSQLLEMERLIDKMLSTEFERYATADLNRPLTQEQHVLEGDKLVSIIFGMLREKHFQFIDMYKEEAFTTIKAIVKQMVIEVVAASESGDTEMALTGLGDQLQGVNLEDWLRLMEDTTETLLRLIHRVKAVHDVMQQASDVSAGKILDKSTNSEDEGSPDIRLSVSSNPGDKFLTSDEHRRVTVRLREMLTAVCDYAHERLGQLVSAQAQVNDVKISSQIRPGERQGGQSQGAPQPVYWLLDKATALQVCDLARVIDNFSDSCEKVCGRPSTALKSAFKVQASKFVQRFHNDRKNKLSLILDSERWKQTDVPGEFQDMADRITSSGKFCTPKRIQDSDNGDRKPAEVLLVGSEKYAVVGTVLLLLKIVTEYCQCAEDLSAMAPTLCRQLAELLVLFNSRCCQLVIGAGALHLAGLKTITSTNLALASRALQLVLWLIPRVKKHFQDLLVSQQGSNPQSHSLRNTGGLSHLEAVEKDVNSHVLEIEGKVLSIIGNLISGQLGHWEAKPPVPSQAFRNISRHLTKLHEAVSNILPESQVHDLYRTVHQSFKEKLRDQLMKMNVVNNWGPQHGVVTSELTFYLETLKTLRALPSKELEEETMESIWLPSLKLSFLSTVRRRIAIRADSLMLSTAHWYPQWNTKKFAKETKKEMLGADNRKCVSERRRMEAIKGKQSKMAPSPAKGAIHTVLNLLWNPVQGTSDVTCEAVARNIGNNALFGVISQHRLTNIGTRPPSGVFLC
uniref:Vacuolar protein sorting-associated protein 54 n=1 Tax=Timema tahoe TaxID=61484 RepID=A0A7R9FE59_9NEOP|nr:unnamed protein product [Timema tahoe]